MMAIAIAVAAALGVAALAFVCWWLWRRRPQELKTDYFQTQWHDLQGLLRDKTKWPEAIASADKLLDTALKKKRIRGHTMGERLVKAQRLFTDNDSVWFGHKLHNRLDTEPETKLKEADVKQALVGMRQALKDVGALPDAEGRNSK